ncbi:SHOCT domain-containing protein [Rhodococcus tukisamuensis]|nr:SHOCT domain-containing protein [Rhodococcus tukisamuensis]
MDMYWNGHNPSGWMYAYMAMGVLVFVVLLVGGIVAVVWFLGRGHQPAGPPPPHHSAQQLLAERFARGEIDEEEFRARSAALQGRQP